MSKSKIAFMIVTIMIALVGIVYISVNTISYFIYESRSCNWANIYNIEMRTKVDLPKTSDCSCSYNKETDSKTAIFTLDLDSVAIMKYADVNGFKPMLDSDRDFNFRNIDENVLAAKLWHKSGLHPDRESYRILLDPKAKKMYVSLSYLN